MKLLLTFYGDDFTGSTDALEQLTLAGVRAALFIDKHDSHITVVSDPLPTILQGIPLRIRQVTVDMDKPGFMLTPTSCDPMAVNG